VRVLDRIVIVGCGAAKRDGPCAAADLYTGSLFRAGRRAAEALAPGRWLILSARFGLLAPQVPVRRYELRLGQPGAVEPWQLAAQAAGYGVVSCAVTVLAGYPYAELCREVWAQVDEPLAHLGTGQRLARLAAMAR